MRTKSAGESALLLLDVIETLRAHSIDYAVVGAMAAAVHGVIRASQDADVIVSLAVRELNRMKDVFVDLGLLVEVRRGGLDDPIQARLKTPSGHQCGADRPFSTEDDHGTIWA